MNHQATEQPTSPEKDTSAASTEARSESVMRNDKKKSKAKAADLRRVAPRVVALARPHGGTLIIGFLALLLGSGINLLFPYLIRGVLNGDQGYTLEQHLGLVTIVLVALFAIQSVFFYVRHYCFWAVGYRVVTDLRAKLFNSTLEQDIEFFDSSRVGDLLSRLGSDTELVQRALTINISVALRYFIQVLGGIALMLVISAKLTALIVMLIPLVIIGSMFWGKKLRVLSRKMQTELGEASVIAEESVTSVRTVRIFAGELHEIKRYGQAIQTALSTGLSRTSLAAMFSSSMVFVMHSAIALVVWYGGHLVQSGELSVGDLTGFLLYCVIVAVSFGFLANTWVEFMQAVGASERIFEIVDQKARIVSPEHPKPLPAAREAALTFSRVSFAYPSRPEADVLKGVDLCINPGKTVALVGPSGAGKSTIASLIPRFYDPTSGEICYGGVPLKDLSLSELRNEISVVAQQPQVFSCSIGDNIRYGRVDASQEEVVSAAEAANIHSFIQALPKGYDTLVGDKGIQLSGGERQRLAIARALLKNPSFLILDEATSALDSENEQLVQQALERLMENRSCLVIAHRLSTVQHADLVHVLKEGQICQTGTHQDLLAQPGLYQRLVQHQLLE